MGRDLGHVFPGDAFASAGSEQLLQVDDWDGLPPVAERAELWQDEGFVLLFAQQREHVLHQLAQPAVTVEGPGKGGGDGRTGSCVMSVVFFFSMKMGKHECTNRVSAVLTRTCFPWSVPGSALPWG